MNEPTINCPACKTEIKLTESLAEPMVKATRERYERRLADKEVEVAAREKLAREQLAEVDRAKAAIDEQVTAKVATEREQIASAEARKARLLLGNELDEKNRALAAAEEVLRDRDAKLAEAQKAQAELIRKERELDDAKREIDLTIEKRVQSIVKATREQYERELADKEAEIAAREKSTQDQLLEVERAKASIDEQVAAQLADQRAQIAAEEAQKVRLLFNHELEDKSKALADAHEILRDRDAKLAEAQNAQAEVLKKQRELDDARRELELTVEKRVAASLADVRSKAKLDAEEGLKLTITEKEEQINSMKRQIEDLKRKAEQGSQQLQGEALELELESLLRSKFPLDSIEPVPKGEFGGDVVQRVLGPNGVSCGTILWESKRTKNWSDGWLAKLRDDQRQAKAELAVLISDVLPKPVEAFGQVDGVWVTERRCAIPVAIALRQLLIELRNSRQVQEGQQTKMELLYRYLTSPRFRQRIEAVVEKLGDMQADLAREKKATIRLWAKREAQIQGIVEATVGMYGDMQGIAGQAMQEIPAIEVPLIDASPSDQGALDV